MSEIKDNNNQQIIDEYESKKAYFDGLRDDITNLEKSINDMKANIKNTIDTQERVKQSNYSIRSQLEDKTTQTKTTEENQPSISDIIGSIKL